MSLNNNKKLRAREGEQRWKKKACYLREDNERENNEREDNVMESNDWGENE